MPCKLTQATHPGADFVGKVGEQVQLAVSGTQGQAVIVAARYAGQTLSAPWQFQIKSGINFLVLLIENSIPRDWTRVEEVCDSNTRNTLREYRHDPYGPSQAFEIAGAVSASAGTHGPGKPPGEPGTGRLPHEP